MIEKQLFALCALAVFAATAAGEPFTWGGRERHPAVVNPVLGEDADSVLSLCGTWNCTTNCRNAPMRNGIWGFFPKQEWKDVRTIEVPSCWESQGLGSPAKSESWDPSWDENSKPIRHKYMGCVWYRKAVTIPAAWKGKRVWLKLGGVKSVGWVWVNEKQVALVDDYCGTFKYEVTDLVTPGEEARVVIQVDNRRPSRKGLMSAMHKWGGIYRGIAFEATPQSFIDDAWVRGDFDRRVAEVRVTVGAVSSSEPSCRLRATVGRETAEVPISASTSTCSLGLALRDFRPWSPEHPNLYTAKVELVSSDGKVLQMRFERFGVRKLEVVGREFRLNGKPLFLRGFGDDHVYPLTGMTLADRDVHRSHLAKARAAGFNFTRLHTHCEVPEYFEAADELGILIQAELPYYSDVTTEGFAFDPKRDVTELYEHYRRHPSFAVYSMGNEGSFGDALDRRLHQYVKTMDPDRLKINHDVHMLRLTTPDRSDYDGGPIKMWPRGSHKAERPFVCHEYLNLCVKTDSRSAEKYTGVWQPPVTRDDRAGWLARFGLGHGWGDRLQDAQHALQAEWQKRGIECARADPGCGGYLFWTINDVVVWNPKAETYSAQGLFDPFWDEKPHGLKAKDFAAFNSSLCVLADITPSNVVHVSGERFRADILFANFGDAPIADGVVEWRLLDAAGARLASGAREVGALPLGPARKVAAFDIAVPEIAVPVKASLEVTVRSRDGAVRQSNAWNHWMFPKGPSRTEIVRTAAARGVTIATAGSDEAKAALAAGRKLVLIAGADGKPNVSLGWWWMGSQVGTAVKPHPCFGGFPREDAMTPLWFRLVKDTGLALPVSGLSPDEMIMVGEGGEKCYCYLAERRVGASRVIDCHGLDLVSDLPEANALLSAFVDYLCGPEAPKPIASGCCDWFEDAKFGMFVHWGLYSIPGQGEWVMSRNGLSADEYHALVEKWNPAVGAEESWVKLAAESGVRYMLFTTRHHDGFALFDSKANDFNSMHSPAKRDHVRAYVEACRKYGIKIGFYYSLVDWRYEKTDPERMKRQVWAEVEQLMTEYGKVDILWYDGGWLPKGVEGEKAGFWRAKELNARVRAWQPGILINDRAGTKEDIQTIEGRNIPRPPEGAKLWEACLTLQDDDWSFWGHCRHTAFRKTPEQIVCQLLHCLEVGGNLIVNVGPAADGSIDGWQRDLFGQVGSWVNRHADAVYGTRATDVATRHTIAHGWTGNSVGFFTRKGDGYKLYFHAWPGTETSFPVFKRAVKSVRLDGRPIPFSWNEKTERIDLKGLPENPPDPICTVLDVEGD